MTDLQDTPGTGPDAPLSLDTLPPPIIEPIRNARLAPVAATGAFAHGVFRPDLSFCELSRTRISDSRFTARADTAAVASAEHLQGRYLFAGIGRHHFGHFLMETASRLWALDGRQKSFDGLIIVPAPNIDFAAVLRRRLQRFFDIMGCTLPIHLIEQPVVVDELLVPAQGFGHLQWTVGNDAFRQFVRAQVDRTCPPFGPERIYISRSKLKHAFQRIDQEDKIEALMAKAGYTIFHPERHNVQIQCQTYRAAHTIVGGDGSAFHLVPFAMQPETRIGLIQRRARLAPVNAIARQITAFAPVNLLRLDPLHRSQEDKAAATRRSADPLDLTKLTEQLEAVALI